MMTHKLIILNYCILIILFINFPYKTETLNIEPINCDYSKCSKLENNKLNVHLVAHSHDDVGWIKTVDQYYYGSKNSLQRAGIQYIIDTVIRALIKSPERRFIIAETAYFCKWWKLQNNLTKNLVNDLVQIGQLEFVGGGWSMNDEATTHYNSIIDQMSWGIRRLYDIFGNCGIPKVAWQIDPFGHSRESASLFAQMNFDTLFFARLEYQEKEIREKQKTLEMIWNGNNDLGKSSDIFTGIMDAHYSAPQGFCFDLIHCNNDPIIDDPESEEYNVNEKVNEFKIWAKKFASKYATNNIMVPMGDDFMYQNAESYFKNIDKLIKYINIKNDTGINIFYSTPSCYAYAVQQSKHTFTVKTDDFLPLGSEPHSYWTGFFTSRPSLKFYERFGNNFLQICKQLSSITLLNDTDKDISVLRESMGILQHHDAITGTEFEHVARDYARQLSKGINKCENVIQEAFNKLIIKNNIKIPPKQIFCKLLNESTCDISEGKSFTVTIYNPIGRTVSEYIHVPVSGNNYKILDNNGNDIEIELIPIPDYVLNIPGRKSKAINDLKFKSEVPPLGFNTYIVKAIEGTHLDNEPLKREGNNVEVKGKSFSAYFNYDTGNLERIQLNNGPIISLKQSFHYYKSLNSSSPYYFSPDDSKTIDVSNKLKAKFFSRKSTTEIQQTYNSWIGQTIRIHNDNDYIEFDWVIGPIPFDDGIGKEIIMLFESDLKTNKIFYTDSNGRQMMKRMRDHRISFNYTVTEPIAGNYYPVNSRIAIRDESKDIQLTVLSDRSQGGSSIRDGTMEIMIHRRLLHSVFGMSLNETGVDGKGLVIRGKHYLIPSKISDAAKYHRDLSQRIFMKPLLTFTADPNDDYEKNFINSYSGINHELPKNIHILTLEPWRFGNYLLRLEHFYESKDNPNELSKPTKVVIKDLFKYLIITNVTEMSLIGVEPLGIRKRLEFNSLSHSKDFNFTPINYTDFSVILYPMQIRTFILTVKK